MYETKHWGHTYSEIRSQPQVWEETLQGLLATTPGDTPDLSTYEQVIFTGCGSTFYLSQWAARQFQQARGIAATALPASEILLFRDAWLRPQARTLLVAVSRSGETSETLRAVELFHQNHLGDVLAVTCYPESRLARRAPSRIVVPAAQERSVAQTRSFTSMVLAIAWLIARTWPASGVGHLSAAGSRLIDKYEARAKSLADNRALSRFFFLGSGPCYGLACEAMLKMKEMSLSYSEAYHFPEFRHGPMSMVGRDSLVIGLLSSDQVGLQLGVLRDMRALGAMTLAIAESAMPQISEVTDSVILLDSGLPPVWRAAFYLPMLQLLAYYRALDKGLNPDRPTHLEAVVRLDL